MWHIRLMNKLLIPYKNKTYTFRYPSEWAELSTAQLEYIAKHFHNWLAVRMKAIQNLNEQKFYEAALIRDGMRDDLYKAFFLLNGMGPLSVWMWLTQRNRRKAFKSLLPDEAEDCVDSIQFLLDPPEIVQAPYSVLSVWVGGRLRRLKPPHENFENITGVEFHFLDKCFQEFAKDNWNSKDALDVLSGIIMRESNGQHPESRSYTGDMRVPFNHERLFWYRRVGSRIPQAKKRVLALWYYSWRLWLTQEWKEIFDTKTEDTARTEGGFLAVFRALGGSALHMEEASRLPLSTILYDLQMRKEEAREAKRKTTS